MGHSVAGTAGHDPYEILTYYYGENIDIVSNAPVRTYTPSYPA